ncbi:MAG: hypothetical protein ACO1QB_03660 [Verrucomicrobiales bacterium]
MKNIKTAGGILLAAGLLLIEVGCKKEAPSVKLSTEKKEPSKAIQAPNHDGSDADEVTSAPLPLKPRESSFKPGPELTGKGPDSAEYIIAWNKSITVDDYQKYGNRSPKWDAHVITGLEAYSKMRSYPPDSMESKAHVKTMVSQLAIARKIGCTDPLVGLLLIMHGNEGGIGHGPTIIQAYARTFSRLKTLKYSPIWQLHGHLIEAESRQMGSRRLSDADPNPIGTAMGLLKGLLEDEKMPPSEAASHSFAVWDQCLGNDELEPAFDNLLTKTIEEKWSNHPFAQLILGEIYIEKAWRERGGEYAYKVNDQQWEGFKKNLALAEKAVRQAWALDSTNPRTATRMILISTGMGYSKTEMELWFRRAIAIDPSYYIAAKSKMEYLQPKWMISLNEMLEFGQECVESSQYKGKIPLLLADAHAMYANSLEDEEEVKKYWSDPKVWKDTKKSYDKYLVANPKDFHYRLQFAKAAYHCGQPSAFLQQLNMTRGFLIDYSVFGGKTTFDEMVRNARMGKTPRI